jgi:hypothetical protein
VAEIAGRDAADIHADLAQQQQRGKSR